MVKQLGNQTVKRKIKKACSKNKKRNNNDKSKIMFPTFEQDQQQFQLFGDQYVPDMRYLPNIKTEPYFETAYYPSSHNIDLNSTKFNFIDKNAFQTPLLADGYHTTTTNTNLLNLGREPSPTHLSPDADLPSTQNLTCETDEKPQKIAKKIRSRKSRNSSTCGKARSRLSSDTGLPREKDRARLFNEAFDVLRKRIPSIPASKKLSKIEILRLAICYMSYLKFVTTEDPLTENTE